MGTPVRLAWNASITSAVRRFFWVIFSENLGWLLAHARASAG